MLDESVVELLGYTEEGRDALRIIEQQRALLERALEFCNEWPSHDNGKLRRDIRKSLNGEVV